MELKKMRFDSFNQLTTKSKFSASLLLSPNYLPSGGGHEPFSAASPGVTAGVGLTGGLATSEHIDAAELSTLLT